MAGFDLAYYQQVFKKMGYADDNGAALLLRTQLLTALKAEIQKKKLTKKQAAEKLGVQQPRISEIYALRIDKFSVELLVKYLFRLKRGVRINVQQLKQ
jgi:predicted XRE-type DNA-binding protein